MLHAGGQEGDESATPHYNALHLEEMLRCQLTDSISHALKDLPEVRDGIALLKVWLRQRELDEVIIGGIGSFVLRICSHWQVGQVQTNCECVLLVVFTGLWWLQQLHHNHVCGIPAEEETLDCQHE